LKHLGKLIKQCTACTIRKWMARDLLFKFPDLVEVAVGEMTIAEMIAAKIIIAWTIIEEVSIAEMIIDLRRDLDHPRHAVVRPHVHNLRGKDHDDHSRKSFCICIKTPFTYIALKSF
jgi:hypothetical protein